MLHLCEKYVFVCVSRCRQEHLFPESTSMRYDEAQDVSGAVKTSNPLAEAPLTSWSYNRNHNAVWHRARLACLRFFTALSHGGEFVALLWPRCWDDHEHSRRMMAFCHCLTAVSPNRDSEFIWSPKHRGEKTEQNVHSNPVSRRSGLEENGRRRRHVSVAGPDK